MPWRHGGGSQGRGISCIPFDAATRRTHIGNVDGTGERARNEHLRTRHQAYVLGFRTSRRTAVATRQKR